MSHALYQHWEKKNIWSFDHHKYLIRFPKASKEIVFPSRFSVCSPAVPRWTHLKFKADPFAAAWDAFEFPANMTSHSCSFPSLEPQQWSVVFFTSSAPEGKLSKGTLTGCRAQTALPYVYKWSWWLCLVTSSFWKASCDWWMAPQVLQQPGNNWNDGTMNW